jgi:CBS-domain-containing membrane protein
MNLSIMTRRPVVTLNVTDHCRRAAELMMEHHIRHLPVLDEEVPVGMVSERDLLSAIGWWGNSRKTSAHRHLRLGGASSRHGSHVCAALLPAARCVVGQGSPPDA